MDLVDIIIFPTAGFLLLIVAGGSFNFPDAVTSLLAFIVGGGVLIYAMNS